MSDATSEDRSPTAGFKVGDKLYSIRVDYGQPRLEVADVIDTPLGVRLMYYWPGSNQTIVVQPEHAGRDSVEWHVSAEEAVKSALVMVDKRHADERAKYNRLIPAATGSEV